MKRLRILPILLVIGLVVPAGANASPGAQLWAQAGCGGCHTLAAVGSSGQVGPNLDVLRPSAARIAYQITYGGAVMPAFSGTLSTPEIQALASWVASVAGGGTGVLPMGREAAVLRAARLARVWPRHRARLLDRAVRYRG